MRDETRRDEAQGVRAPAGAARQARAASKNYAFSLGPYLAGPCSMNADGTVANIMNPKLLYIREGDRLALARAQILKFGVTAVPVLDEAHRPVGLVSLRDLQGEDPQLSAYSPVCIVRAS